MSLLNKVFAAHGMINNHKETERDDFFEYYKRMFSNSKFKHIRSVYEEIEWTIELSNMYDDYTPMEFVVQILENFFKMNREKATRIMLHVHTRGKGVCGVFTRDVAETKVAQVNDYSRMNNHPLLCAMEEA